MVDSNFLDQEDIELFRRSVGTVKPLYTDTVQTSTSKPAPVPEQKIADERAVLVDMANCRYDPCDLETGDELLFKQQGVQNKLFEKFRRGQFTCEAVYDLHGLTVDQAKSALSEFIKKCRIANYRCVRIIHGKGLGSRNGRPVLKNKLNKWLQQRDEILAFCSARQVDGGTGAVYVLLKKIK